MTGRNIPDWKNSMNKGTDAGKEEAELCRILGGARRQGRKVDWGCRKES